MLKFIIGVFVGGIVGFLACAVLSFNRSEKEMRNSLGSKEMGDIDDGNK